MSTDDIQLTVSEEDLSVFPECEPIQGETYSLDSYFEDIPKLENCSSPFPEIDELQKVEPTLSEEKVESIVIQEQIHPFVKTCRRQQSCLNQHSSLCRLCQANRQKEAAQLIQTPKPESQAIYHLTVRDISCLACGQCKCDQLGYCAEIAQLNLATEPISPIPPHYSPITPISPPSPDYSPPPLNFTFRRLSQSTSTSSSGTSSPPLKSVLNSPDPVLKLLDWPIIRPIPRLLDLHVLKPSTNKQPIKSLLDIPFLKPQIRPLLSLNLPRRW
jgi:hypothetical protein